MNIKKYLKEQAKKDIESLRTERDEEFLQQLKDSIEAKAHPKKRNMKWFWAIPSGALVCAVATVLIVELVPFPNNDLGDVKYEETNFKQETSDNSELSKAVTDLTLSFTEEQEVGIMKIFDSVSGDELYYELTIDENSEQAIYSMKLVIVVNDNYDYSGFEIDEEYTTEAYSGYSIIYKQQIRIDPDTGLNMIEGSAKIDNTKYEIYVLNYEEYSFDNGMFLTVINNMIDFN